MKNVVMMILLAMTAAIASRAKAQTIYDLLPSAEQGKVRAEKTFTVGLPVSDPYNMPSHYQIRPTGKFAIGLSVTSLVSNHRYQLEGDERVRARLNFASLYGEYYPLERSGFHLGVGAEKRWGSFRVIKDVQGEDVAVMEGEYEALYGGPSFGWTWLWSHGLTVGFDLSKRKRFDVKMTTETRDGYARADRESELAEQLAPESVAGTLLLGYSF